MSTDLASLAPASGIIRLKRSLTMESFSEYCDSFQAMNQWLRALQTQNPGIHIGLEASAWPHDLDRDLSNMNVSKLTNTA